jgi:predicted site-specific integrase-resolvase
MPNTPTRNLLPDTSVCRELDISQRTLQRHLREGKIDAPIGKLGKNRRGWTRPEIELIREQLAHRESAKAQPA